MSTVLPLRLRRLRSAHAAALYWVDIVALASAGVVYATGLVLLLRFHVAEGALRSADLGLSRLAWVNAHRVAALVLVAAVAIHLQQHWRSTASLARRAARGPSAGGARADLVLCAGFAVACAAAYVAWFAVPGSPPLLGRVTLEHLASARHRCIDLHFLGGLAALPSLALHVRRHLGRLLHAGGRRSGRSVQNSPAVAPAARRGARAVNSTMYDALGPQWWDERAGFEVTSLRYCLNPVRYEYFGRQLRALGQRGRAVLDVGCGGGYLAEAFARDGYEVTGIDPSAASVAAAEAHADAAGLSIRYRVGRGEMLPLGDASFDIVACCDVLEHVDDVRQVLAEVARVLRPGGVLLFDTVNRTLRSWLVLIKVWQDWGLAGFSQPQAHEWSRFIRPRQLHELLRGVGLTPGPTRGIGPARHPALVLASLWRMRGSPAPGHRVARDFAMCETDDLGVSYMGWAVKR